jgi:hypothetical protein
MSGSQWDVLAFTLEIRGNAWDSPPQASHDVRHHVAGLEWLGEGE